MGHMLNNTIQDVLIRRARSLLVYLDRPHHLQQEAKVVAKLKSEGINS
jgi:hypothetical protein